MASEFTIATRRVRPTPSMAKGKGGEADIFTLGDFYNDKREIALKLYKTAEHPDYKNPDGSNNTVEQRGASARIDTIQKKLPAFPKNMPPQIVSPIDMALDKSGTIRGFTLEFIQNHELLIRYGEKNFRNGKFSQEEAQTILRNLRVGVSGVHQNNAVLGDFNDLNVLVSPTFDIRMIDADSIQFGNFLCKTFTAKFVDPTICTPDSSGSPMLAKLHNKQSDWYAFAVMYMQVMLYLDGGPYGGVFKPKDKSHKLPHPHRWQKRVTVFNPEVVYPKPSIPYRVLPDEVLHYLEQMFVHDKREEFPEKFVNLNWTVCNCGASHARSACPICQTVAPTPVTQTTRIQGKVTVTSVFSTSGTILYATVQNGKLLYVYHDGVGYRRENGTTITNGALDPQMRYRIQGSETLLGKAGLLVTVGSQNETVKVDHYGNLPIFDANGANRFWLQGGKLFKNATLMGFVQPEFIGEVLESQTLFWVGPKFGFGFYRAGELSVAFVFDTSRKGINDSVKVPLKGTLIDSTCVFSDKVCWFMVAMKEGSKFINHCYAISFDGTILAHESAEKGSEPWLDNLRGKFASNNSLYVPTDEGLKTYAIKNGRIERVAEFPDTENLLDSGDNLFGVPQGIYVVRSNSISLLQMK